MADEFKMTESHAAVRARLLAGAPKLVDRRANRKPELTRAEEVRAMQKRAWAKINAEHRSPAAPNAEAPASPATVPPAKPTADRIRAAQRRGMRQSNE